MVNNNLQLPQASDLEAAVLGAMLLESDSVARIADTLRPEHFYDALNRQIYEVICQMYDNGDQIDLYTALMRCKALRLPTEVNIASYLAELTSKVASAAHIEHHAQSIVQQYIRRNTYIEATRLATQCLDNSEDVADILSNLNRIADEGNGAITGGNAKHIGEVAAEALREAEKRQQQTKQGICIGIPTGITRLDTLTGGWKPTQLIVLAARPAMGKTAVMLHFALSAAQAGKAVCIYSLEMSDVSLANRLLLSVANVDAQRYRAGNLTNDDWHRLEEASATLNTLPIYIDDNPSVTMRYIRSKSKMMQKRGQCDIIFADYLQLVDMAGGKGKSREQEVAQASRAAKVIAKELNVPFVLLSQLSRKVEDRADKTPQLSDLRESGAIEQDADVVAFIHRPAYYDEEVMDSPKGQIPTEGVGVLTIAKQRDGGTEAVIFSHNYSMTRIGDYDSICYNATQGANSSEPF